jgi:transcriptional regulator with XRE-family HTH domain
MRERNDHPIETMRRQKNLTREQLSVKCGVPAHTIRRISTDHQIPDYDTAVALAGHFEMPWHRVVELCVQHRDREMRKFFSSKKSENTTNSHVCAEQEEKCGAR